MLIHDFSDEQLCLLLKQGPKTSKRQWNSIPEEQKDLVVELALEHTELSSRELAHKITNE